MASLPTAPAALTGWLLAHQGGWDEMLMVAVPIATFAALLFGANRRARRMAEQRRAGTLPARPAEPPRNEHAGPI